MFAKHETELIYVTAVHDVPYLPVEDDLRCELVERSE